MFGKKVFLIIHRSSLLIFIFLSPIKLAKDKKLKSSNLGPAGNLQMSADLRVQLIDCPVYINLTSLYLPLFRMALQLNLQFFFVLGC